MITRDAKIGLLVVLAFCLIVGILLSEQFTTIDAPKQASLAAAGDSVRQATKTPVAPVATEQVVINADPKPSAPLVTRDVLDQPAPTAKVELGQAANGEMTVIRVESAPNAVAGAVQVSAPAGGTTPSVFDHAITPPAVATETPKPAAHPLAPLAAANGLELVPVDPKAQTSPKSAAVDLKLAAKPTESLAPAASNAKVREYVAGAGDTLNKIAGRMLGANTPANRQAIIDLNPSLQKNPERIVSGAKYLIPADAWAAALGGPAEPAKVEAKTPVAKVDGKPSDAKPAAAKVAVAKVEPKAAAQTVVYEVKSGDSLWKLANGDKARLERIKSLNGDALKDADVVQVGMKLTLPGDKQS